MTTQNQNDDSVEGDDSAVALAALYAAERTEVQNILGHALSLLSVLMAYSTFIGVAWAARAALILACASSRDAGDGLLSTLAKPKSLRLRVGKTCTCRWGTSSPAMITPARSASNARHTALPIS